MFLYEELDALRKRKKIAQAPEYIAKNLNAAFELRKYQVEAFENFVEHFESDERPRLLQVLFHMATGSGKTLIMAGLMLYLYKQGYRNFLFFVNLTNIIDKTRENFLNVGSAKYLFADEIIIDGERVRIKVVENFQAADDDAINICFDTTQGLHSKIWFVQENAMTLDDFNERKVVLISDESHHLNVTTKKGAAQIEDVKTWEQTVKHIFKRNAENILLEITATCDLANAEIHAEYKDKIIFDYPLQKFYNDKYSKDIVALKSDCKQIDKALQALILSQYRLKVFQANRLNIKPVILFKSRTIAESKSFMAKFIDAVKNLDVGKLKSLRDNENADEIIHRAFKYFEKSNTSLEMLTWELQNDFSEPHCISVNDDTDAENQMNQLNTLESSENPYRAIFEVKKLDEGWDVLNLFDIVRLYETRQSGGKKISATTISEAQLIGRGSRYCPFQIYDDDPKFQRKYDSDLKCDLRVCETLYYHCQTDSKYITELKAALREIGLDLEKRVEREYKLKKNFTDDDLYKYGNIFLNKRVEKSISLPEEIAEDVREKIYRVTFATGESGTSRLMKDGEDSDRKIKLHTVRKTIGEIAAENYAIVNKALIQYPVYKFDHLKACFKDLKSTRQFITGEKFLGNIKIDIKSPAEELSATDLYFAVCKVLGEIAAVISKPNVEYEGTKEFYPHGIGKIFTDTTVHYPAKHEGGQGVSQSDSSVDSDLRIDLTSEDWFAQTDNYGTVEEKALVAYFRDHISALKKIYKKIFLVRNERHFHIYSFENGRRFEPDFVLFLQKDDGGKFEQLQIFIEPKGTHLAENDAWKEKFLIKLGDKAVAVKTFVDDDKYLIYGFHFYNQDNMKNFDDDFMALT